MKFVCAKKTILQTLVMTSFIFWFVSLTVQAQSSAEVIRLEVGKPIDSVLLKGQKNQYLVEIEENQYAKILIKQISIDIEVRVFDPNGVPAVSMNLDRRINGSETVEIAAKTTGKYLIVISSENISATGNYSIDWKEKRISTEQEKIIFEARVLESRAATLWVNKKSTEALSLLLRELEIVEKILEPQDKLIGRALYYSANIYSERSEMAKAESNFLRALKIHENSDGESSTFVQIILTAMSDFYRRKGDFLKAEETAERAITIGEGIFSPIDVSLSGAYNNRGAVAFARGDNDKALFYFRKSLIIRENAFGSNSLEAARIMVNIANLTDDLSIAEPMFLRALAIQETASGQQSASVGRLLYSMARATYNAGEVTRAEGYINRALPIYEKSVGMEHPDTALPLNLLGLICLTNGKYDQAVIGFQRSLAIQEKRLSSYHPSLVYTFQNLAKIYALKGDFEKAISAQARAKEIDEFNLLTNLKSGGEREKIALLQAARLSYERSLILNFLYAPDSQDAVNLAASGLLLRKGRVLDVTADQVNVLRKRLQEKDLVLLDKLAAKNKQISEIILSSTEPASRINNKEKIVTLIDEREKLEGEISRRSATFFEKSKPIELTEVQAVIPENSTLLEFVVYLPLPFNVMQLKIDPKSIKPHYAAFIMRNGSIVMSKDLGEGEIIEKAIEAWRKALRDPLRKDVAQLARAVDEKVMQPLRPLLGDAKHLLISPDGFLNLIPFEALVDEKNKFLIENYALTYLTSGRDLLRMEVSRNVSGSPVIIADPLFGEPEATQIAKAEPSRSKANFRTQKRQSVTTGNDLSSVYFSPLNATASEANAIRTQFPDSLLLTGANATEAALKQVTAPKILHIATHGFFLTDQSSESNAKDTRAINAKAKIENPLLRSGLALAGANLLKSENEDGILTALEASGLNLWGTKLVTLSACDTGIGEVKNGEGVYGLRRAFVLAGTESLVMSLWPVSDLVTRELMTGYYKGLKQGLGRGEALRQVQLKMLKRKSRAHPFYWASFIQSGEWANLDGKR
jgi:CHAT domain-containing protein